MLRFPPLPRRAAPAASLLLAGMSCWSGQVCGQETPPPTRAAPAASDTVRLTEKEQKAILDTATVESAAAARGEMTGADRAALEVHGEVGVAVGSNGARAVYGTAAVPLGDHAGAVVSFESSQFDHRR